MVKTKDGKISSFIISFVLFITVVLAVHPILNLLALSFTHPGRVKEFTGADILPKAFSLMNYRVLLNNPSIVNGVWNSSTITIIGVCLSVFLTTITAYALSREELKGRKIFIVAVILVMIFEPGIVPEYFVIKNVGLINSIWSVILFRAVNVYYLIILMRFFDQMPRELLEAAKVEGAGHLQILFRIVVPLSKASIATITLFYFVFKWNEYFRATIYLDSPRKWPLQVVLRQFVVLEDNTSLLGFANMSDAYGSLEFKALQAAAVMVGMLPILMLYPVILKFFTKGAMDGSVKE